LSAIYDYFALEPSLMCRSKSSNLDMAHILSDEL
jgi:hypothetical protein